MERIHTQSAHARTQTPVLLLFPTSRWRATRKLEFRRYSGRPANSVFLRIHTKSLVPSDPLWTTAVEVFVQVLSASAPAPVAFSCRMSPKHGVPILDNPRDAATIPSRRGDHPMSPGEKTQRSSDHLQMETSRSRNPTKISTLRLHPSFPPRALRVTTPTRIVRQRS